MVSVKLIVFTVSLLKELQTSMVIGPHSQSSSVFLAMAKSLRTPAAVVLDMIQKCDEIMDRGMEVQKKRTAPIIVENIYGIAQKRGQKF